MKILKLELLGVQKMDINDMKIQSGGNCIYQDAIEMRNAGLYLYRHTGERSKKLEKKLSLCLSYLENRAKRMMIEAGID